MKAAPLTASGSVLTAPSPKILQPALPPSSSLIAQTTGFAIASGGQGELMVKCGSEIFCCDAVNSGEEN